EIAMPRQRLVDRVVADLEHHVVQAGSVVGIADVHAGPLADGIEPFEDLDRIGAVVALSGVVFGWFSHDHHIGIHPRQPKRGRAFSTALERRRSNEKRPPIEAAASAYGLVMPQKVHIIGSGYRPALLM